MFSHLVESDLHRGELKRKGTFFLVTTIAYALLLMAAGVVGVYAYEANIEDQNLVLVALVPPDIEETKPKETPLRPRVTTPTTAASTVGSRTVGGPPQPIPSNTSADPTKISGPPQTSTAQMPPTVPEGSNRTPGFATGPYNPDGVYGNSTSANRTGTGDGIMDEAPPAIVKKPQERPRDSVKYIGVANSLAVNLPEPAYPQLARTAGIQGPVNVEIMIDETGRVISARATSGNPLLRQESEKAAYRASFTPTLLSNQPVKAKGIITYNFVLRK